MQQLFIGTFLVFLALVWPHLTFAHSPGQPPFFKINGVYAEQYVVPTTSIASFELPQDSSSANYYPNVPLDFEIDQTRLPVPSEVIARTNFNWQFGDGATATGLKNSHIYTQPGPYLLKLMVDDGTTPEPQVIQTTLINILPNQSYRLPKAVIKINGQTYDSTLNNVIDIPFNQPITFDATASQSDSSQINSYFWDFGDQTSSDQAIVLHTYQSQQAVNVVLRVTDSNGFFNDFYVQLQDRNLSSSAPQPSSNQTNALPFRIIPLLAIPLAGIFWYFKIKRAHSS